MPTIFIEEGFTSNDKLRLSDGGFTCANKGAAVFWKIRENSGVAEIRIEEKSGGEIWKHHPSSHGNNGDWKGVIKGNARDNALYDYAIVWRSTEGGRPRVFDPKIAVLPSGSSDLFTPIALVALSAGLVAFSFLYFSLKRKHKRLKQQQGVHATTDFSLKQT